MRDNTEDESVFGAPGSSGTAQSTNGFKADAEAARTFATSASPVNMSSASDTETPASLFEASPPGNKKRETVIGPKYRRVSLQKGEEGIGSVVSDDESVEPSDVEQRKENRMTVIGPSSVAAHTQAGAEQREDDEMI